MTEASRQEILKMISNSMERVAEKVCSRTFISPETNADRVLQIQRILDVVQVTRNFISPTKFYSLFGGKFFDSVPNQTWVDRVRPSNFYLEWVKWDQIIFSEKILARRRSTSCKVSWNTRTCKFIQTRPMSLSIWLINMSKDRFPKCASK